MGKLESQKDSDSVLRPQTEPLSRHLLSVLARPLTYVFMSAGILALDLVTGPYLMFPILFVIPVTISAWLCSIRLAIALAVFLPVGRFFIAAFIEHSFPPAYAAGNALIRIAVLSYIGYLVARTSRQTKELQRELTVLEGLLRICMFCKRIRDENENWQPIEGYISQRSDVDFSHGLCPECAQKHYGEVFAKKRSGKSL
jgi:hypothetical protein